MIAALLLAARPDGDTLGLPFVVSTRDPYDGMPFSAEVTVE